MADTIEHPSQTPGDLNRDSIDLGCIFIGREQQIDLFEMYLNRWKAMIAKNSVADWDVQNMAMAAPSPDNKIEGMIVLLYGRGGIGKSTLLRRFRAIVLQENDRPLSGRLVCPLVDWEKAAEGKRGLFNISPGKEIDAPGYFQMLCAQLAGTLGKQSSDFRRYQQAVKDVEDARKQANRVIESSPRIFPC
jgi:hypothetical protein